MPYLGWADAWFQRVFPLLLGALVATTAVWFVVDMRDIGEQPAVATQAVQVPSQPVSQPLQEKAPAQQVRRIREGKGVIGRVQLGMSVEEATAALDEELVTLQEESGTGRFELLARKAGLKLAGARGRIDTVTVTNVGAGRTYVTARGVRIGDPSRYVRRRYIYARDMCGREWWVERGPNMLRLRHNRVVTAISVTSQQTPLGVVPCT